MIYTLIGENQKDLAQVFKNRGLNYGDIMGVTDKAVLPPDSMKHMKEAVETVHSHLERDSIIYIQQDPDADGMTSTAALYQYLKTAYPKARLIVGIHEGKQHGIDVENVHRLIEEGKDIRLIIAPDASSNEHDIHEEFKASGIDVVVLDHHDAESYSPFAVMVNPQLDDYANKNISGVGVVLKFAQLFDKMYGFEHSSDYYDLAAVGMIGDMIEITTPETVFIVQKGMSNVKNPFLKALYAKQAYSMKNSVTPIGISFYIVPLMNAVTRAATMEEKALVLEAMLTFEDYDVPSTKRGAKEGDTETLCEQAVRIMANIKARQDREVQKAMDALEQKIEAENLNQHQLLIIDAEGKYSKDYTGLIANKIMAKFQKPTLIGSIHDGENLAGSGRSYDKSSLPDLKSFLQESGIMNFAEGHGAAHGFSVHKDKIPALLEYANRELVDLDFTPRYLVDFEFDYATLDYQFLESITNLDKYWAKGFEEPYILFKNIPVPKKAVDISGSFDSHTLKITLPNIDFLKFRVPTEDVQPFNKNELTRINVIGRVSMNEYQGKKKLQVFVQDFEVSSAQAFYF